MRWCILPAHTHSQIRLELFKKKKGKMPLPRSLAHWWGGEIGDRRPSPQMINAMINQQRYMTWYICHPNNTHSNNGSCAAMPMPTLRPTGLKIAKKSKALDFLIKRRAGSIPRALHSYIHLHTREHRLSQHTTHYNYRLWYTWLHLIKIITHATDM